MDQSSDTSPLSSAPTSSPDLGKSPSDMMNTQNRSSRVTRSQAGSNQTQNSPSGKTKSQADGDQAQDTLSKRTKAQPKGKQAQKNESDDKRSTIVGGASKSPPKKTAKNPAKGGRRSAVGPKSDVNTRNSNAQAATLDHSQITLATKLKPKSRNVKSNMTDGLQSLNTELIAGSSLKINGPDVGQVSNTKRSSRKLELTNPESPVQARAKSTQISVSLAHNTDSVQDESNGTGKTFRRRPTRAARASKSNPPENLIVSNLKDNFNRSDTHNLNMSKVVADSFTPVEPKNSSPTNQTTRRRKLKREGEAAWKIWRARKERILEFFKQPVNTDSSMVVPDGFNLCEEEGVYVFSPTAAALSNFETFLEKAEEVAGRRRGVVKVILPREWTLVYPPPHLVVASTSTTTTTTTLDNSPSTWIRPYNTKLNLHVPLSHNLPMYKVSMLGAINTPVAEWQQELERDRESVIRGWALDQPFPDDVYNAVMYSLPEKQMIARSQALSEGEYYAEDIEATDILRRAMQCGGPDLRRVQPTNFQGRYRADDKTHSFFQVSGAQGSPFGLRTSNGAAYILNYLYRGAPKKWTIFEPSETPKLEEFIYEDVELAGGRLEKLRSGHKPPTHPPRCDQFLAHEQFYLPQETLLAKHLKYSETIQYQGEIIIIFPLAYYQGYSTGPSLAESRRYVNRRSKDMGYSDIWQWCSERCTGTEAKYAEDHPMSEEPGDEETASNNPQTGRISVSSLLNEAGHESTSSAAPIPGQSSVHTKMSVASLLIHAEAVTETRNQSGDGDA